MALHFDYASAAAPTSSKRPAPTATRGSSYTAPLALRFLYSFVESKSAGFETDGAIAIDVYNDYAILAATRNGVVRITTTA